MLRRFSGNSEMSGLPEPAMPAGWGYSYLDWIGAYSFALAIVGALYYRNATGGGQWIDASQCEAGHVRRGHHLPGLVRQRAHVAAHRQPLAVAAGSAARRLPMRRRGLLAGDPCFDEGEWPALCRVADQPEWRSDARFASLEARLAQPRCAGRARLETGPCSSIAFQPMGRLQAAGVAAGVCQTAPDRYERDPQLQHLNWMTELPGTKIGTWPVPEVPVRMSGATVTVAGALSRGAPYYGEDNDYVYGSSLGCPRPRSRRSRPTE